MNSSPFLDRPSASLVILKLKLYSFPPTSSILPSNGTSGIKLEVRVQEEQRCWTKTEQVKGEGNLFPLA